MKDIIIVGGGLTGMLAARSLHDAGVNVMLIDQNELGSESSWAGNGVISPLYPWRSSAETLELTYKTQQQYADLCAELQDETRINPELMTSGLLSLDADECTAAAPWLANHRHEAVATDHLDGSILNGNQAIKDCEPSLQCDHEQAVFLPNIRQVRNPHLVQAVAASLRHRPLMISEHQPVTKIKTKKNRAVGVKLKGKTFKADKVILAAGVNSDAFAELKPVTDGQSLSKENIILFRGEPGVLNHIVVKNGSYLIPRKDGRILCGTSRAVEHKDTQPDGAVYDELREFACGLIPALEDVPIRHHWAGLYARNAQHASSVGAHAEIRGLYVNTGHGEEGMATGLASVQKLVAEVLK
uniref:Glycine oxidase n=1 Tax=uncultured Thiotrichaceae bacterium TaxID=298394 RepID=A0A6S6UMS0_9GAMM|nr:MAG: Glycine oxidase [uncultured Thiotrichaceae bacterium]